MIGLVPNDILSMSGQEKNEQTASNRTRGSEGGTGQRSSVFVNFAQEGSSLSASADGGSKVAGWLWAVLIGGSAIAIWWAFKRRSA